MKKLLVFFLLFSITVSAQQKLKWPHHKKAVIVLTYDDALQSQLDVAVPQLEAAHLTGTFFLTGDANDTSIMPRWRELSKKGFELANHTVHHPCSANEDTRTHSGNYTVKDIITEIADMNHILFTIDGKTKRTFAYPCTETTVGNGKDYVDSLSKSGLIKYARIGGDTTSGVLIDFAHINPLLVPCYGLLDNTPGSQLIAFVKRVERNGGMGIIMMHGIGGDYIITPTEAHQQLVDYLKKNKKTIWVATFQQAMDYAMAHAHDNEGK
jgi:peptidoglycan/xylan/chitin deacetylase (PgdA/CDA1 family)